MASGWGKIPDNETILEAYRLWQSGATAAAQLCLGQGLIDEALAAAQRAAAAGTTRAATWLSLAGRLIAGDRLEDAREVLEQALAADPRSVEALNNLGTVLQRLGRTDLAATRYREALALAPDNAEALSNLAAALAKLGDYDEALASARRAIALKPDFVGGAAAGRLLRRAVVAAMPALSRDRASGPHLEHAASPQAALPDQRRPPPAFRPASGAAAGGVR